MANEIVKVKCLSCGEIREKVYKKIWGNPEDKGCKCGSFVHMHIHEKADEKINK